MERCEEGRLGRIREGSGTVGRGKAGKDKGRQWNGVKREGWEEEKEAKNELGKMRKKIK